MTRKADGIRRRWCKPSRPASGRALMGRKTQNHKTEVSPMTREQLNAKLDRTDISGIGVECIAANGSTVYYFYEDFDGPATGIERAMKQLYPLMDKGKIQKLTFIERRH